MSDLIEAAAKVLCEDEGTPWDEAEWWERNMHRATAAVLHKAGLLATRKEYGIESAGKITTTASLETWEKVAAGAHPEARAMRRYVTEWEVCDG